MRPIKKSNFGEPDDLRGEIKVRFHNGIEVTYGWIIKQKSARSFLCTDGFLEVRCNLVPKEPSELLEGEMCILVKYQNQVQPITKITSNKVTLSSGPWVKWAWLDFEEYAVPEDGNVDYVEGTVILDEIIFDGFVIE